MFMSEPSDINTPHPLDTVDVAMIIVAIKIKFPFLFKFLQALKVIIPQDMTLNRDFFRVTKPNMGLSPCCSKQLRPHV